MERTPDAVLSQNAHTVSLDEAHRMFEVHATRPLEKPIYEVLDTLADEDKLWLAPAQWRYADDRPRPQRLMGQVLGQEELCFILSEEPHASLSLSIFWGRVEDFEDEMNLEPCKLMELTSVPVRTGQWHLGLGHQRRSVVRLKLTSIFGCSDSCFPWFIEFLTRVHALMVKHRVDQHEAITWDSQMEG